MRCEVEGSEVVYASQRTYAGAAPAEFRARYQPVSEARRAEPGSLEHWLTSRYCLFSTSPGGEVLEGEIDHEPWPLQDARARIEVNTMAEAAGLELPALEPLLHFSRRVEVVGWAPSRR
jgi:uncharacterized protein YqjF (DUF2071 family)